MNMEVPFMADIFASLPKNLDTAKIYSAEEFVLLHQIVRTPIILNKTGQAEGDLLESWKIDKNHKIYTLKLKNDLKWSDGSQINAKDLYNCIQRQMTLNTSNHYNFSDIKIISLKDNLTLDVELKKSNYKFLTNLAYPEFGVLKFNSENMNPSNKFSISSGAYFIKNYTDSQIILSRNNFYTKNETNAPNEVIIKSSKKSVQIENLLNKSTQMIIPSEKIEIEEHNSLVKNPNISVYDPNIGFTFWININANSEAFRPIKNRKYIQYVLSKTKLPLDSLAPLWIQAKQLYLPDGFGRPTDFEIKNEWTKIEKSTKTSLPKIKLLVADKFPFTKEIEQSLASEKILFETFQYTSLNEYHSLVSKNIYDLIQINNDFSSLDISDSLLITFSSNKPLIFTSDKNKYFNNLLNEILNTDDKNIAFEKSKLIGLKLLSDGYIYPVAYKKMYFYLQNNINIDNWSTLYPDIKFWKLKLK